MSTLRPMPFLSYPVFSPLLGLLLCGGGLASRAEAATLNVPAQYGTIQAAVNAAHNGDTVVIADGTYTGDGNRDIDFGGRNITVESASGDPTRTIIDCQASAASNHRGFYLHSYETSAVISGLTVENGYEGGHGISNENGYGKAGGILSVYVGVSIQNCVIKNNEIDSGVYNYSSAVRMNGCTIAGNSAGVTN